MADFNVPEPHRGTGKRASRPRTPKEYEALRMLSLEDRAKMHPVFNMICDKLAAIAHKRQVEANAERFAAELVEYCCRRSLLDAAAEAQDSETDRAVARRDGMRPVWSDQRHPWHNLYCEEKTRLLGMMPRKVSFRVERARVAKERRG